MNMVIAKLSAWHRLYLQLQEARARLNAARQARDAPDSILLRSELEAEVRRLQQESDSQLEDLKGVVVTRRTPPPGRARDTGY